MFFCVLLYEFLTFSINQSPAYSSIGRVFHHNIFVRSEVAPEIASTDSVELSVDSLVRGT